jgi:hypothetical protein
VLGREEPEEEEDVGDIRLASCLET